MGLGNLPQASGDRHAKAFQRLGWERRRTTKGRNPHIILTKPGASATLSIPYHKGKDVKRVLIAKLIKSAGLTEQQYVDAFYKR